MEYLEVAVPKMVAAQGSIVEGSVSNDPRVVLQFLPVGDPPNPPQWMSPAPLPRSTLEQSLTMIREIDEMMFTNEASRGVSPGDRFSGRAIAALNDYNNSPLIMMLRAERYGWADIGAFVLAMYANHPGGGLWKAVMDSHGVPTAHEWTPDVLDPDAKITVRADSDIPQSPTIVQERLAELAGQFPQIVGLIDPVRLLEAVGIPGARGLVSRSNADAALAQWENAQIGSGEVLLPMSWHNHAVHISEHNWQRNQPEYLTWPEAKQRVMDEHIQAHENLMFMEAQRQAALNAMQPGLAGIPQASAPVGSALPEPEGPRPTER
jgi:hypothetical protein